MLLVIDAGNTNTEFAVIKGDAILGSWRVTSNDHRTADEYAITLRQFMVLAELDFKAISEVILSSVVPQNLYPLKTFCRRYFSVEPMAVGEKGVELGIEVKTDIPEEVGADRLVNAVAAFERYQKACIIVDFGTATTFDVVNEKADYLGGVIAPGITLSMHALHRAAAKLPEIAIEKPKHVVGKHTIAAMQSGVYWGYLGLIEGIVKRLEEEHGSNMQLILTGGLASAFAADLPEAEYIPSLTIEGLKTIYQRNAR